MTIIQLAEEIVWNFKGAYNEDFIFLGTTFNDEHMIFESDSRKLAVCSKYGDIKEIK